MAAAEDQGWPVRGSNQDCLPTGWMGKTGKERTGGEGQDSTHPIWTVKFEKPIRTPGRGSQQAVRCMSPMLRAGEKSPSSSGQ